MEESEASLFGLQGKNILVVGGGAGIGERTAIRLAQTGCNICIVDVSADNADAIVAKLRANRSRAEYVVGDVTDPGAISEIVTAAWDLLGGLDGCVTVVGASHQVPLAKMSLDFWQRDIDLNLRHVFLLFQEVANRLISARCPGSLVCVTSVSGLQAAPDHAAYGAAKAALKHLVKSMAIEWAEFGIRVNSVAPGTVITPRVPDTPQRTEEVAQSGVPMRRRGTADEVAKGILFMMSDLASYVTGHNLLVDGGWMAANLKNRPGWRGP
ncbi:SDR family NAD(P)-dependent oxidoreductase [Sphingobium sp. V4]|uniref:SDR family NAD(P)-dependent oxidoreductase n=1 Tax=Sphingobium sp. V4 TaxID=3038927 RepID=UPI0025583B72|nr:SDR family NAD(P)-dependent oxidoreductase [Sphingobium sp. V4]WIW89417.1 SDR family NAD(P)-dependent oxidoreductase [Sphingobium sp. V4]